MYYCFSSSSLLSRNSSSYSINNAFFCCCSYREKSTADPKKFYLTNAELLESIAEARTAGKLTNRLAKNLHLLAERYSYKGNWVNYSFREDMVSSAVLNLCANWHKFDPDRSESPNPFAFYTTAVYRSFLQYISDEKKHRDIRDELLIDSGANPSFSYQERHGSKSSDDTAFRTAPTAGAADE